MSNHHKVNTASGHGMPDLHEIEMVFGTPHSPKDDVKPNIHLIENEKQHDRQPGNHRQGSMGDGETHPAHPLLEPDKEPLQPPLAGPEIDDLESSDGNHSDHKPFPGIDDGLLEPIDKPQGEDGEKTDEEGGGSHHSVLPTNGDGTATEDDGSLSPRFGLDDRPGSPMIPFEGSIPDVNTYQQKKNLAQGMMDLALLSANANQLRYVLESSTSHPYYYPSVVFICVSIILQIAVGVGLIMNSRYNVKDDKDICKADKINNMTVLGVFLVTIVNVFITSFSVASPPVVVGVVTDVQQAG